MGRKKEVESARRRRGHPQTSKFSPEPKRKQDAEEGESCKFFLPVIEVEMQHVAGGGERRLEELRRLRATLRKKASRKEAELFVSLSLSSLRRTVKAKSHAIFNKWAFGERRMLIALSLSLNCRF
jgi:hypothetical protein